MGGMGAGRGYHPYAHAAALTTQSAQSSPMAYSVPLGYDHHHAHSHSMTHSHSRPQHSRSSSGSQMHHVLGMEGVEAYAQQQQQQQAQVQQQEVATGYQGMYRTESPMQYAVADTFDMEQQQQQPQDVQSMYVVGLPSDQQQQYGAPQAPLQSAFYPHPHHSL